MRTEERTHSEGEKSNPLRLLFHKCALVNLTDTPEKGGCDRYTHLRKLPPPFL